LSQELPRLKNNGGKEKGVSLSTGEGSGGGGSFLCRIFSEKKEEKKKKASSGMTRKKEKSGEPAFSTSVSRKRGKGDIQAPHVLRTKRGKKFGRIRRIAQNGPKRMVIRLKWCTRGQIKGKTGSRVGRDQVPRKKSPLT